jgi:RNA polymerase sigma factor (sigma-70 family)
MKAAFERAFGGDRQAQAEIVQVIRSLARAACRNGGPGGTDCDWEDVAQEASQRFFAVAPGQFRKPGAERSYLYAIVRSTVLQMVRRRSRRRAREEAAAPEAEIIHADPTPRLELGAILRHLSHECARLLRRVFLDDEPYAELATELGMLESSVRVKVSRCLRQAREAVEEEVAD